MSGGSTLDDVLAAQELRKSYTAPPQSKFRVAAVLRFRRADGSEGVIEAVNAEPHDANIRGAICAERAALCRFQREEPQAGTRVIRVVCVTDSPSPIWPGPMCREFLTASCDPDAEVAVAGSKDPMKITTKALRELLPLPSVYRRRDQPSILAFGKELEKKVSAPPDKRFAAAYAAAVEKARSQQAQLTVFPVVFAAAVHFDDGRVHCVCELKGMEYGCTVDAVSLLMPEIIRARDEKLPAATCVVQADQFGVAHAPFAAARTLLVEHGFTDVLCSAHNDNGDWTVPMTASDSLPGAFTEW